eukprot:TRINITY_DN3538_c0_g1_i1.p2 TRINITY_DN3538_c0_g1~~TRINITY_DN3538_c0_g1_i1.p2  ORF type:complete len:103 (+),score=26.15 TRINITY_DN3538_c0_g1_i1:580-888(+)
MSKACLNMMSMALAVETGLVSVAVRPGVVDTAMQGVIREDGDKGMDASVHDHFKNLKKQGQLLAPSDPAKSIAKLALHASETFSGKFVSWNDAEVMDLPLKL